MVVLSARIEDPKIAHSLTKNLKRRQLAWRLVWIGLLAAMLAAGVYGYYRYAAYGRAKVALLVQEAQQDEAKFALTAALAKYTEAQALQAVAPSGAAEAYYRAALLYEGKADHAKAQELLKQAEQLDDAQIRYPLALGRSLVVTRSADLAEQAFDRALALEPNNPEVLTGKARVALLRQDPTTALELLGQALDQHGDNKADVLTEATLLKAILDVHTRPTSSSETFVQIAGTSSNKGFAATARTLAPIADQINTKLDAPSFERVLVGAALIEHNELDLALLELRDATERDQSYRDAWVNRAEAELLLSDLDSAQASIDKALLLDPTFGFSRFVVGQIAQRRDKLQEARSAFEQALEQRYNEPQVYLALADVLVQLNDPSAAIKKLQGAVEAKIESHEVYDRLFWLLVEAGKDQQALQVAQRYTTFDDRGTTAQGLLAYAQLLTGTTETALKTAESLLTRDPLSAIGSLVVGVLKNDRVFLEKARDLDLGGKVAHLANQALEAQAE
ncbi:MAG: tetratricopeptide repeat protein [Candidatus Andersenbacteria bacterium]